MTSNTTGAFGFAVACAACWAAVALLAVVLARIGVAPQVLVALLAGVLVLGAALGGALGGAMRFAVFLAGGRALPPGALSIALAAGWTGLALNGAGRSTLGIAGAAAGLLALAWIVAPALRRSGAPSLPGFLRESYDSPALGAVATAIVASTAALLGAERLLSFFDALTPLFGLGRGASGALVFGLMALMLVPGGVRSLAWSLLALGTAALACAAVIAWWFWSAGLPWPALPVVASAPWSATQLAALALTLASPHLAMLAAAADGAASVRRAGPWAAALTLALWFATMMVGPTASLGPVLALALLSIALDLACAGGLLLASGVAVGFDLPGRPDRKRRPTSRRFAWLRFSVLAVAGLAVWAAALHPDTVRGLSVQAAALIVAGVAPVLLIAVLRPGSSALSGLVASSAGLVTALAVMDGRVFEAVPWASPVAAEPGLAGLTVAFAVGLPLALASTRRPPSPPLQDEAF